MSAAPSLTERLAAECRRLVLPVPEEALPRLVRYGELLLQFNASKNLVGEKTLERVVLVLILDALALLPHLPAQGLTLLDIGTGGGLPGVPLALCRLDGEFHLLDRSARRTAFLKLLPTFLPLGHCTVHTGEAGDFRDSPALRGRMQVVTARGVATLGELVEMGLPFLAAGGRMLFPRGADAGPQELLAGQLIGGAQVLACHEYRIPLALGPHYVVEVGDRR